MWTLIIIIVVVVVVDDVTYYWVHLSSDHLFQVYYKVRQLFLLQSAMVCYCKVRQLFYYKVRQVLQSVTILLQSATIITICDSTSGPTDPPKENGRKFASTAPVASKFRLGNTR